LAIGIDRRTIMKKIDVGQTVSIFANLGVVAGIAFLAIEVGQNNELMRAAARDAQNERIRDYVEQVYTTPGLAEIIVKARSGTPLTDAEDLMLFSRQLRLLRGFEVQHREYVQGAVDDLPWNWKEHFYEGQNRNPPLIGAWEEAKTVLRPDFVLYIEENILDR
jgi:hypothetical protein